MNFNAFPTACFQKQPILCFPPYKQSSKSELDIWMLLSFSGNWSILNPVFWNGCRIIVRLLFLKSMTKLKMEFLCGWWHKICLLLSRPQWDRGLDFWWGCPLEGVQVPPRGRSRWPPGRPHWAWRRCRDPADSGSCSCSGGDACWGRKRNRPYLRPHCRHRVRSKIATVECLQNQNCVECFFSYS